MRFIHSFVFLTALAFLAGCDSGVTEPSLDPSNLTVDIQIASDQSGDVQVILQADNAVEYTFSAGDGTDTQINTSGTFSHTYTATNFYTIEVRAYGENGRYLSQDQQVAIDLGTNTGSDEGYVTPLSYDGMTLIWQDEFAGDALDESKWNYEIGDGCPNVCGWGNNELEYYRKENMTVQDGYAVIEAREQSFGGKSYTSSRVTTQDKFEFTYGRVDIRARLPYGQGIWPALWMLGANINQVSWPACGEVDIMELVGGTNRDNVTHGTVHWDNNGYASYSGSKKLSEGIFNDEFHVFSVIWDNQSIKWLLDDQQFHVIDITPAGLSEFHNDYFLIMNVAVGGNWPGSPNSSTQFPQQMVVDYIRVFQPE